MNSTDRNVRPNHGTLPAPATLLLGHFRLGPSYLDSCPLWLVRDFQCSISFHSSYLSNKQCEQNFDWKLLFDGQCRANRQAKIKVSLLKIQKKVQVKGTYPKTQKGKQNKTLRVSKKHMKWLQVAPLKEALKTQKMNTMTVMRKTQGHKRYLQCCYWLICNYLALEDSQSFKISSLIIGHFPTQVSLMKVMEGKRTQERRQ